MKHYLQQRRLSAILAAALPIAALPLASSAATSDWSFDIAPYLWIAGIDLKTSLPSAPPSVPGVERFDTRIACGAMLTAEAHYRSFGVLADFAWLRLDTESVNPGAVYSSINLRSDFVHSTAALTYRLPLEVKVQAELLVGARVWYVANDVHAASTGIVPAFSSNDSTAWADPMVGGSVSYAFTPRWSADAKGMIGGFGVSAKVAGEAFAGVTYHFSEACSATLGYRYLHEEYQRDDFTFDMNAYGALLGIGFHF